MSTRLPPTRRTWTHRLAALLTAGALVVVAVAAPQIEPTEAAWRDSEFGGRTVTASLATPTRNACGVAAGVVNVSWFASTRASAVPITYSYRVLFANGTTAIPWTSVGTSTSTTIPAALLALGTYTLQIRADSTGLVSGTLNAQLRFLTSAIADCTWQ